MTSFIFFSSRRRHTRLQGDWSSDVCSSDLFAVVHGLNPETSYEVTVKARDLYLPQNVSAPSNVLTVTTTADRKSVVKGKSVDMGDRQIIKAMKRTRTEKRKYGKCRSRDERE